MGEEMMVTVRASRGMWRESELEKEIVAGKERLVIILDELFAHLAGVGGGG